MSKLHIFRDSDYKNHDADGDGNVTMEDEFKVKVTKGAVTKGRVYWIRQGMSNYLGNFDCVGDATFRKVSDEVRLLTGNKALTAAYSLREALLASLKTVTIQIDPEDQERLKDNRYKLCFAKKVAEGDYNVVWQSYEDYLSTNEFSWTPQYQIFGSNDFKGSVKVHVSTNLVDVGLGEEVLLDKAGNIKPPKTGGEPTAITLHNEFGSIHPGLNQLCTGIDGMQVSTPIYVAPSAMVLGDASLTPVEKVLVWFEQSITTSTMFSTARSQSIEIDLTFAKDATRLYKGQKWILP